MIKKIDLVEIVSDSIGNVLFPGKKQFDEYIIDSEFNQKHKLIGYNPFKYLFTPFDLTPVGAVTKVQKGYKAIRGGNKLIRLGISGFGKRLKNKGYTDIGTVVISKGYQFLSGKQPSSSKKPIQLGHIGQIKYE